MLRDFNSVPEDLVVPAAVDDAPAAGRRVKLTAKGFEGTRVHHTIYLPADWSPEKKFPVIFEYAGNGDYSNPNLGDACEGSVEGCHLGYGLSAGRGFIWVCLPFVEIASGTKQNAKLWWGDVEETVRYCHAAIDQTVAQFGGDPGALILCGFSRGAIGCNFIGLHDDRIAARWRAFLCCSHYDGVITGWPYAGADRASALKRLKRLKGRPQFICMERSTKDTEDYLKQTGITGSFIFVTIPFPNHNDRWVLRDIPERKTAREWLARVLQTQPAG
ncbi:MAG: hypothetical protein K8R87_04075 [Verrucomicrobia bacterium]|nr:hypothetical protein [Verrucomicrobiota bacterium]